MQLSTASILILALGISSAYADVVQDMAQCEVEAMRYFGALRKPHQVSGSLWPTNLEREYRESCMVARGFELDWDKARTDNATKIHGVLSDALWRWDAKYWRRRAGS